MTRRTMGPPLRAASAVPVLYIRRDRTKAAFTRRFSSSFVRSIGNAAIDRCNRARARASVEARTSFRALLYLCFYLNLISFFRKLVYISAFSLRRSDPTSSRLSRCKDNSNHKMIDQPAGKGPPSAIMLALSVLTHLLLLAPVIYILVLAFDSYSFFSWHPICMSVGVGLLIPEAIFIVSGETYLSWKVSRFNRVTIHWILHTVGLALVLVGLIIIVVNKINNNREHFATPHSILGLVSIILAFLTAAFGIVTKNSRWVYPRFRPVFLKIVHAFDGILVIILLLATLITGTYTRWWPGGDTGRSLTFTAFFIAGFFILLKPVLSAVSRSKVVFGPPPVTT